VETEETQNTKVVEDFPSFPKTGKAPDFDTGRWSSWWRKVGRFLDQNSSYVIFEFFWLSGSQTCFIMQYEYVMPHQHVSPIRSSPKEKLLPNIDGVHKSVAKSHSSP
jgi:hypothetical protein